MDRYKRIKIIGKGSFGKAFLVHDTETGQECVVKQMETAIMDKKEQNEAVKEALVLKKMSHPNIISFQEVFMTRKGRLCIVMDYADGGDVHTAIKNQNGKLLEEALIVEWFVQCCFALKHVHSRKVLHRDLKTQNIFLMSSGQIKMGDFGIAKMLEATKDYASTMVGTPYYLSPEIIQERPYAYKSDVWSLGVVLYEMATQTHPFDADSLVILAGKILRDQIPPLDGVYSDNLQALVRSMLSRNEAMRPDANELLRIDFLSVPMQEANEKYTLGLDLSEYLSSKSKEPELSEDTFSPKADVDGRNDGGDAYDDNFDEYSGGSDAEEQADQPNASLTRSVRGLKFAAGDQGGDAANGGRSATRALEAKVETLRCYLIEQTSAEDFAKAYALVQASGAGDAEDLQRQVGNVIGADTAAALLCMFQLLRFLEETVASLQSSPDHPSTEQRILDVFRKWDVSGDGVIPEEEFQQVLRDLGMRAAEVQRIFEVADANRDGNIDYAEFTGWLYSKAAIAAAAAS